MKITTRNKTMIALVASTILINAQPLSAQTNNTDSQSVLTLQEAVDLAKSNNRQLLTANDEFDKKRHEITSVSTALLPKVDLMVGEAQQIGTSKFHFDKGSFGTYPMLGAIPGEGTDIKQSGNSSFVASLMLTQPITQIPRIRSGIEIKRLQADIAHEEYRNQSLSLTAEVTKVYMNIGVIDQVIKANDASIRFLKELEYVVKTNYDQGTILESDLLDVRAKLARQEHIAITLQHQRDNLCEQLNQMMGRPLTSSIITSNSINQIDLPESISELQDYALSNAPAVHQTKAGIEIAKKDYSIRLRETRPDVSLAISYSRTQQLDVLPDQLAVGMVVMKWDSVFDWGKNRADLKEKQLNITQANRSYDDVCDKVALNVDVCYRTWQDAQKYVDVCRKDVDARHEVLRVDMERYKVNKVQLKDVLESEAKSYDAEQQHFKAQADVIESEIALMSAIGKE